MELITLLLAVAGIILWTYDDGPKTGKSGGGSEEIPLSSLRGHVGYLDDLLETDPMDALQQRRDYLKSVRRAEAQRRG